MVDFLPSLEPGTWTELIGAIVGATVAAVLGGIAVAQGRKANFWAQKAAESQNRANALLENTVTVILGIRGLAS